MADYVAIQNENLEPGAPWISSTAFALRDNPLAIAEGAAGAPRIQTAGINNSAVTAAKLESSERMTTGNVNGQIAASSAGAVGTYAMLAAVVPSGASALTQGATLPGSSLQWASANGAPGSASPSGTWRLMGRCSSTIGTPGPENISMWLRVS